MEESAEEESCTLFYTNAPLVEVIAELRWKTSLSQLFEDAAPTGVQVTPGMLEDDDDFFARFSNGTDELGFRYLERLVPPGQAGFPGQPTLRFRLAPGKSPLLQLGNGVFTANGLPPEYRSWTEFSKVAHQGVEQLIRTRNEDEQKQELSVSLRYLDSFNSDHWGERPAALFISEVLGFRVTFPEGVVSHVDAALPIGAAIQAQIPLTGSRRLQVAVGEGTSSNRPAVVLDIVVFEENVRPDPDAVMQTLQDMHQIHSDMFVDVAKRMGSLLVEAK